MMRLFGLMTVFVLGGLGSAFAQLSPDGGPIQIEAGKAEILDESKRVVYTSNVDVVQGNARLQSDVLTINFAGSETDNTSSIGGGFGDIDNMSAAGNVHYVTTDLKARGDGNVILARGEDIAKGECLTLQISAGKSTLGCAGTAEGTERVIIQINPTERGE